MGKDRTRWVLAFGALVAIVLVVLAAHAQTVPETGCLRALGEEFRATPMTPASCHPR